ncbi:unnamed protein product [Camellia sinensis]
MTDVRGSSGVCDDKCGCPSPCPGSSSCSAIVVQERGEEMIQAWKTRDARVGSIAAATPAPAPRLSPLLLLLLVASALKVAPVLLVLSRSSSYYSTPFYHYY